MLVLTYVVVSALCTVSTARLKYCCSTVLLLSSGQRGRHQHTNSARLAVTTGAAANIKQTTVQHDDCILSTCICTLTKLQQAAVDSGASLALDGRNVHPAGFEKGNFLGPTVLTGVQPGTPALLEEIFGPVLSCMTVDSLEAAIELVNSCKYGNGTAIFTQSGAAARKYQHEVDVGQVGINVALVSKVV
jgi:acyl-CoA reductase-like NAD-dependent aldehyde dehydrogenase